MITQMPHWAGADAATPEDLAVPAQTVRIDITEHLLGGRPPHVICRELGVEPSDVTDVLASLGRAGAPLRRARTVEQHFRSRTRHAPGGHLLWLGEVARGVLLLRHHGRVYSPPRIAWRMTRPGEPDGPVVPGCAIPLCVAPDCLIDRATQRRLGVVVHQLFGDTSQ